MHPTYAQMNHELAAYQGFPADRPVPVGDPMAGLPIDSQHLGVEAAGACEVLQARRQLGAPHAAALSESDLTAGGVLIPPVTV